MVLAHVGHGGAGELFALAIPVVAYGVVLVNRGRARRAASRQAKLAKTATSPSDARR